MTGATAGHPRVLNGDTATAPEAVLSDAKTSEHDAEGTLSDWRGAG